jgi:hypothetical protein
MPPGSMSVSDCVECETGKADTDFNPGTPCDDCAAGTFSIAIGATVCDDTVCQAGAISGPSSLSCELCPSGCKCPQYPPDLPTYSRTLLLDCTSDSLRLSDFLQTTLPRRAEKIVLGSQLVSATCLSDCLMAVEIWRAATLTSVLTSAVAMFFVGTTRRVKMAAKETHWSPFQIVLTAFECVAQRGSQTSAGMENLALHWYQGKDAPEPMAR